jgi:hypothetical protein
MPIAKEKSNQLPKVKLKDASKAVTKEKQEEKQNYKSNEKKLAARADYRPEGWFAVVSYEGSNDEVFAQLAASEESAYEDAITEIQRIKLAAEGTSSATDAIGSTAKGIR